MRSLGVCGLLLLAIPAMAPGQVELAWKWKEGQTFYVSTRVNVKQTLRVEGVTVSNPANDRELQQEYRHSVVVSYRVRKLHKDGSAEVVQRIEELIVQGKKKGEVGKTDTLLGPKPGQEGTKKEGAELVLHLSPQGQVTRIEGYDKLLARFAEHADAIQAILPEEALKAQANQSFGFLPQGKVKAGATWERTTSLPLGALGWVKLNNRYTYEGKGSGEDRNLEKIAIASRLLDYTPTGLRAWPRQVAVGIAAGGVGATVARPRSLGFQVIEGRFKDSSGKATLFFDAGRGRLIRARTTLKLKGDLTISNVDATYRTHLIQEQESETKVMDKMPGR
jgi:Family of unknown function (DUF6263)